VSALLPWRSIRPLPPTTRAIARSWHLRSPSAPLVSARRFAPPQPEQRCQGFSPSQPGHRRFVRHTIPKEGRSGRVLPAPIGWGSHEETMPRARDVAPHVGPPVSTLTCLVAEPGPGGPSSVFSALRRRDPTRLPRIQSAAGGPVTEPRSWSQQFEDTIIECSLRPFDLREPSHPCAK
jgi:hypothetical protein